MYVLQNWTFTPGAESAGTIELPGVYTIEQFAHITNLTRNIPLFDAESYEATITLVDDGLTTTLTLRQNTSFCVMYPVLRSPANSAIYIVVVDTRLPRLRWTRKTNQTGIKA